MNKKYYIINLNNVIKDGYVESDAYFEGIIDKFPFPILAEAGKRKGTYIDIITQELIVNRKISNIENSLHCQNAIEVDARFCEFFLSKLNDKAINKYKELIESIKQYTLLEDSIEKRIIQYNQKAENYIESFKNRWKQISLK